MAGPAEAAAGPTPSPLWRWAQGVSVIVAVAVVALLVLRPRLGLLLTWDLLVPLVPLVLLLAPRLWRNLCPISVVHQLPLHLGWTRDRRLGATAQRWAPLVAIGLFLAIVPLRLVLFNDHGPALAAFVLAVLAVALLGGALYAGKAGWCVTFCPVLPVERLYGQDPVREPAHAHCATCFGCARACYDLDAVRSFRTLVGLRNNGVEEARDRDGATGLLTTPMGVFALAFPGFVLGYFLTPEGPGLLEAYGWTLGGAVASVAILAGLFGLFRPPPVWRVRTPAALALGIYYWFTLPAAAESIREALGASGAQPGILAAQIGVLGVAGVWLARRPA